MKKPQWVKFDLRRLIELRRKPLLVRRTVAVLSVLGCLCVVGWAIGVSYEEETTDWYLNIDSMRLDPKSYRINILSVDEVAGKVQTNVQLILNRSSFVSNPKVKGPIDGKFLLSDLEVRMEPLQVVDLGPTFEAIGFVAVSAYERRAPVAPTPDFTSDVPPVSQTEFSLIGEPKFYPFDKYFVIGSVSAILLAASDKKEFFDVPDEHSEVYLRSPNFVMKGASDRELLELLTFPNAIQAQEAYLKQVPEVRKKIFAVELQRPFFLRFMAIFMFVITVSSMVYYVVVSEVKTFALQALGYFVGLWAVRQMLLSGGPRVFTVVDYVVLVLYVALAAGLVAKKLWNKNGAGPTEPVRQA